LSLAACLPTPAGDLRQPHRWSELSAAARRRARASCARSAST